MAQCGRKGLNWAAVLVSGLVGVLALARLGSAPISGTGMDADQLSFLEALGSAALVQLLAMLCVLLNNRRLAALLLLASVPVFCMWAIGLRTSFVFRNSNWSEAYAWLAVLCAMQGAYWHLSSRCAWPTVLGRTLSARVRVSVVSVAIISIGVSDLIITFIDALQPWPPSAIDCNVSGVFSQSTFVRDTAFVAHVIQAGHQIKSSGRWVGYWALVTVQEQLAGWHPPRLAILTESPDGLRNGDDYFVDGRRPKGLLTRFLPIVEIGICTRTTFLSDAGIPLRLLRSRFPTNDVRIIGRVDQGLEVTPREPHARQEHVPVQGAQAAITGPRGTFIATTDKEGIYDIGALPPGRYRVDLQTNRGSQRLMTLSDWSCDLKPGEVANYSFSFR